MSKVFVRNAAYASREDAFAEWDQDRETINSYTFWNIWKRRAVGWDLEEGSRVLLLATWPGPNGAERRYLWELEACDVAKWEGVDWEAAVRHLGRWTGDGAADIRTNEYTLSKRELAPPLHVLAWRPEPVSWLDAPVPADVRVSRNGWTVLDDGPRAVGRGVGGKSKGATNARRRGGQGRRLDTASKDAVEARAMVLAKKWCKEQEWSSIEDTHRNKSWDYEAVDKKGRTVFIEVKGTTGIGAKVEVTSGEVKAADEHGDRHIMVVVDQIRLKAAADGTVKATGGVVRAFNPWRPRQAELKETRFIWNPDPDR